MHNDAIPDVRPYRNSGNSSPLLIYCSLALGYMGKTNPTYRDRLCEFENEWSPYHRALRLEYQDHFERLFVQARNFADAGGIQNHTDPTTTHLISILLAQECRIADLEERLEAMNEHLSRSSEDFSSDSTSGQ